MPSIINATTTNGVAISPDNSGSLQLATNNGTTAVTIDTNQNVLVGDTTAAVSNNNFIATQSLNTTAGIAVINNNTGSSASASVRYKNSGSTIAYTLLGGTNRASYAGLGANILSMYTDNAAGMSFLVDAAGPMTFNTNSTERMRIDSSGRLLVGCTNEPNASINGFKADVAYTIIASSGQIPFYVNRNTNTGEIQQLRYNNGAVGNISTNGSNCTFNSTSDYRLKENITPMTGALAKVAQLKPVTYTWKKDGQAGEGFIAHELVEVCPEAVTGEKDAVDEKGNPVYQAIDQSVLVATLTAAIQELKAELDATKAEVQALKGVA